MNASQLARYRDMAMLLVRHRGLIGSAHDKTDLDDPAVAADARALASELEGMGPTFVKLGQLLSTRADLLPAPYLTALARLQEHVEPFGFDEVQRIIRLELGTRISNAFASFDERPIAAASLGQVHRAELRDGRAVAVKVQRPNIREQILDDMDAIEHLASLVDDHSEIGRRLGFADMVGEFRRSLLAELDYRQEAANLTAIGTNLRDHERIVVPTPIADYTTGVVLTMDFLDGTTLGAMGPHGRTEIDGPGLADALFRAYLDQILIDGFFHADPHPGNVLVTTDGRLGLIDLGMTARIEPALQEDLVKLLLAIGEGRGHDAAEITIKMGRPLENFDAELFRRTAAELVSRNQGVTVGQVQTGAVVAEMNQVAADASLRLPSELTMLGKALLHLDEIARTLDPAFDPHAAIQRESAELTRKKLLQAASGTNLMSAALEAKEFAERLPARMNQLLDAVAAGELKLNIQGIDDKEIMRTVQKLANRVTAGIVVAALIMGAAMIMRIETDAKLFGYPALAILMFLTAFAAGGWLLINVFRHDLPQRKRGDG